MFTLLTFRRLFPRHRSPIVLAYIAAIQPGLTCIQPFIASIHAHVARLHSYLACLHAKRRRCRAAARWHIACVRDQLLGEM